MDIMLWLLSVAGIAVILVVARVFAVSESNDAIPVPDKSLLDHPSFVVIAQRRIYGMCLTELVDRSDAFSDFIEIGSDGKHNFTRVTISFPTRLKSGIHLALEAEGGILKRLMNMKETRIGHDHFDSQFIVLASSQVRVERTLSEEIREAMLAVREHVDELRVTDESVFVRMARAMTSEDLDDTLPRLQALAHAYYERAKMVEEEFREEAERNPEIPNPQRDSRYVWQDKK